MSCVKRVRETLEKLDDVAAVKVDFAKKTAAVTMKSGKTMTEKIAKETLKKSGYGVTSFKKATGDA